MAANNRIVNLTIEIVTLPTTKYPQLFVYGSLTKKLVTNARIKYTSQFLIVVK